MDRSLNYPTFVEMPKDLGYANESLNDIQFYQISEARIERSLMAKPLDLELNHSSIIVMSQDVSWNKLFDNANFFVYERVQMNNSSSGL